LVEANADYFKCANVD
jgi:hypothetical protein